ncbi:MAG: helix-turn-helix domain-containing protein [Sphingomonas sp.]|uniref:GlxA family transcriptional regulator n=1 Tax=Sphingomonas sp. TaxID=28214 RepID=UPI00178F435A|nr:helix-turn-helix domain-containing protein [Sphingomonas sp.]MBA3666720.1 helix-turn-helix domain-containing protein [Sphingomonas sp.]
MSNAMASSVAITLDVMAMANSICRADGRPNAFEIRLRGSGSRAFADFVAAPAISDEPATLIIIPAQGFSKAECIASRLAEPDTAEAGDWIKAAAGGGARITSSCTGTLLLASTGLLDDRRATTAWWLAPTFRQLFPKVQLDTRELVTTDGPFTTAGAAMAQMDLMVGVIARHAGARVADGCARTMILDERRSQAPYMGISLLSAGDDSVSKAASWARSRLDVGISVDDVASAVGMSPRTFARRVHRTTGLSPVYFLQQLRVERAVELIETTRLPLEEIAVRVGYAEPSTLRALIRRGFGFGPRELRARALRAA